MTPRNHFDMRADRGHEMTVETMRIIAVTLGAALLATYCLMARYPALTDSEQASIKWELETGR